MGKMAGYAMEANIGDVSMLRGADGKSAYQYAQDGGYTGTEEEFAAKMAALPLGVDDTLTQPGQAADAAAVGNRLSALSEENVKSAELDEYNMVSFKNANGIVLFTLDLSELGAPASYGNLVLSAESLTVEEGGEGTFTVALDSAPSANQIVYLAVSDNTRLTVSPVTLTFTTANYAEPQTVTVTSLQDEDKYDDTITVTLTSKKVDGKQLVVTVSDIDKIPQVVTNGLILYADYTTWDGASDTLVDSAGGLSLTGLAAGFEKVTNGVKARSDVSYKYVRVTRGDDAYAAFQEAYNANREWTFEWFGNYFMTNFFFRKISSTGGTKFGNEITDIKSSAASGTLASDLGGHLVVYRSYLGSDGIYKRENFTANWNFSAEYLNDFIHLVVTAGSNGEMKVYHNGSLIAENTVEDFGSWPTMDTNGEYFNYLNALLDTGSRATAQADGAWVSSQRMYNRVLTQEEIISNMKAEASRLGLSTFQ